MKSSLATATAWTWTQRKIFCQPRSTRARSRCDNRLENLGHAVSRRLQLEAPSFNAYRGVGRRVLLVVCRARRLLPRIDRGASDYREGRKSADHPNLRTSVFAAAVLVSGQAGNQPRRPSRFRPLPVIRKVANATRKQSSASHPQGRLRAETKDYSGQGRWPLWKRNSRSCFGNLLRASLGRPDSGTISPRA